MHRTNIVSLFERQVEQSQNSIALAFGERKVSYSELNKQSNRLSRHLISLGVSQNSLVGVCLNRSIETIIGILGILKSGAAYLPIDIKYPAERILYILNDAEPFLTITSTSVISQVSCQLGRTVLLDNLTEFSKYDSDNLSLEIGTSDSAYVMYTSGTTGSPKGTQLPHSGVCRLVKNTNYIEISDDDVLLHHSSDSFDAATFEIWAALLNGATLVLYPVQPFDVDTLNTVVTECAITVLLLTTSVFHLVVQYRLDCLAEVKKVVVGGDVLQAKSVDKALRKNPCLTIINGYGPTENTVFTCCYSISKETTIGDAIPIGTPITGTNIFVLDEDMNLVKDGDVGELYASGLGLAKKYINKEATTVEKFLPCPFSSGEGILYKTGDLVKKKKDGLIYFVGRKDNQIKIRGFRIEPSEIEQAINSLKEVEESVVLPMVSNIEEKYLVAFVRTSASCQSIEASQVKRHLSSKLPEYMVPSVILIMERFPINNNGKIDKEKLLDCLKNPINRDKESISYLPGQNNSVLNIVLNKWREQVDLISLKKGDSINDYGVSSLTTMIVQSRLNEHFGCEVDPIELSYAKTPSDWANIYLKATSTD